MISRLKFSPHSDPEGRDGDYWRRALLAREGNQKPCLAGQASVFDPLFVAGFKLLFGSVCPLRVEGLDFLDDRNYLFAANHKSHLDSLALFWALRGRHRPALRYLAAREWHSTRILNRLAFRGGAIGLDRGGDYLPAMREAAAALRAGQSLLIFPEGHRPQGPDLAPFKPGVAWLSAVTGAPIVPVHIEGTGKVLPKHQHMPCPGSIAVRFGRPIAPDDVFEDATMRPSYEAFRAIATVVRDRVRELGSASP